MIRLIALLSLILIGGSSFAHQFTPTYPRFSSSFIEGVVVTEMRLFNRRDDVEYYQVSVFDSEWNPIEFATENKIVRIGYLQTKPIHVYVNKKIVRKVVYICTESKLMKTGGVAPIVSSRICSKVKS